jgi:hypothetical protein
LNKCGSCIVELWGCTTPKNTHTQRRTRQSLDLLTGIGSHKNQYPSNWDIERVIQRIRKVWLPYSCSIFFYDSYPSVECCPAKEFFGYVYNYSDMNGDNLIGTIYPTPTLRNFPRNWSDSTGTAGAWNHSPLLVARAPSRRHAGDAVRAPTRPCRILLAFFVINTIICSPNVGIVLRLLLLLLLIPLFIRKSVPTTMRKQHLSLLAFLFVGTATANSRLRFIPKSEFPNEQWISLDPSTEFHPASTNTLTNSATVKALDMASRHLSSSSSSTTSESSTSTGSTSSSGSTIPYETQPFVEGVSDYSSYQQAWRLLGFMIDCDVINTGEGGSGDKNKNGNGNQPTGEGCQRYVVWAAVRSFYCMYPVPLYHVYLPSSVWIPLTLLVTTIL